MVSQRSSFICRLRGEPEDWEGASLFDLREGLHEELYPEEAHDDPHGGEALRVHMGRVQLEVFPFGRADETLQDAHWGQALQVPPLREAVLAKL